MDAARLKDILKDRVRAAHIGVFSVMALLTFMLIVRHDIGNIFRLSNESREAGRNLATLKQSADYKIFLNDFKKRSATGNDAGLLMELVSDFSKREDVAVELLRPWETGLIRGTRIIRVLAEGRAPYANIMRLLNRLENYEKFLHVEELGIAAEGLSRPVARRPSLPDPLQTAPNIPVSRAVAQMRRMASGRGAQPFPWPGPAGTETAGESGMPPPAGMESAGMETAEGQGAAPSAGMGSGIPAEPFYPERPAIPEERIGRFRLVIAAFNVER